MIVICSALMVCVGTFLMCVAEPELTFRHSFFVRCQPSVLQDCPQALRRDLALQPVDFDLFYVYRKAGCHDHDHDLGQPAAEKCKIYGGIRDHRIKENEYDKEKERISFLRGHRTGDGSALPLPLHWHRPVRK